VPLTNGKRGKKMAVKNLVLCVYVLVIFVLVGCSKPPQQVTELKRFPIDSFEGIITQFGVQFNKEVSSDENGSLKIIATEPTTVRIKEIGVRQRKYDIFSSSP
jgi:hypothetical protein